MVLKLSNYRFKILRGKYMQGFYNLISTLTVVLLFSSHCFGVEFSKQEQEWLDKNIVLRFSEVNWKPLSYIDDYPEYRGIIADYLSLVCKSSGMKVKFEVSRTWHEVISKFQKGDIDLIPALSVEDDIENVIFTKPYISFPLVIATQLDIDFIGKTSDLNKKKVGVGKGYTSYYFLKKKYPKIELVETDDVYQGLRLLDKGEIFAFVGHLAVIVHTINHNNLDVKVAGKTEYNFEHRMGLNIKNKDAVTIFNKAFSSIDKDEHNLIFNKWVNINGTRADYRFNLRLFVIIGVFVGIVAIFVGYRYRLLNRMNKRLIDMANTDELTKCANRKKINEDLDLAHYNLDRYKTPFSLILLDLDNFKKINDTFGHSVGDKVLKILSIVLKNNTRKADIVGRWGGEEFIIICPNTTLNGAKHTAVKLLNRIAVEEFGEVGNITASFGIAECENRELLKDLFVRIDKALYEAKHKGKNRIEIG